MKKLGLIFVVLLCFSLFLVPSVATAQTASEQLKAAYAPLFKACSDKLGAKLYDPVYKYDKEVTDCLSYGDKANGNTVAADTGVVVKQVATDSAKSLTTQYNQCITDAGNDAQKKANCESLNTAAKEATSVAASTLTNADVSKIQKDTADKLRVEPVKDCGNILTNFWGCVNQGLVNFIKIFLLNIAGFLLWVSANMLNYSIKVGILDFARWAPDTLYPIWIVVRQIVSLFVVFAGLYLGLMYIIGKDEKFEKYIPWVVIFALFVNFSYPLARTAIDVSNVVSLNIYTGAVGTSVLTGDQKNTAGAIIMQRLGLEKLVTSATENNASTDMVTGISSPAGALMAIIFVLFSAYIFFMVTWLIIARTAVLIFLTIASPILFVDSVIPKLGDVAMKLRKMFVEQLFVGPVFMIMLALTLKFLEVFNLSKTSPSGSGTFDTTIVEFFNITMMLIMLHIMRKVTMSTAGSIGETVSGYMGKVGGFATGGAAGLAMGGAGFLARGTMGRAAAAVRDSKWVTNNQNGILGRHAYNMTNSIAKSSFDARNSSYVQTGAKKLGMGLGMGSKMGFEERTEARDKERVDRLKLVGTYKKNTYNDDGTIKNKKGSVDTSEEAQKARQEYITSAAGIKGGSLFNAGSQEKADLEAKLKKADELATKKILTGEEKELQEQAVREAILKGSTGTKNQSTSSKPAEPDRSPSAFSEAKSPLALEPQAPKNHEHTSDVAAIF
jgi:hypothetical protein